MVETVFFNVSEFIFKVAFRLTSNLSAPQKAKSENLIWRQGNTILVKTTTFTNLGAD